MIRSGFQVPLLFILVLFTVTCIILFEEYFWPKSLILKTRLVAILWGGYSEKISTQSLTTFNFLFIFSIQQICCCWIVHADIPLKF